MGNSASGVCPSSCLWPPAPTTQTPTPTPGQTTTATQPTPTAEPTPTILSVVTTTSIVADWVENIGGDNVEVFSLVPRGVDPHGFQPGARDVARVADADIVLTVGLGLEESWLRELLQNAARDPATIIELADSIEPIEFGETHIEDVEFLEELSHVVHEVEEGEISAEEGLEEIAEVLEGLEDHEEDEAKEKERWKSLPTWPRDTRASSKAGKLTPRKL